MFVCVCVRAYVVLSDFRARWVALGGCFEKIERPVDAIHAYERAVRTWFTFDIRVLCLQLSNTSSLQQVATNDVEGIALRQLAKLYDKMQQPDRSAQYHRANLEQMDAKGIESPATVEALWFLARYCAALAQWKEAERYCFRLLDFAVPEKEDAKILLKVHRVYVCCFGQSPHQRKFCVTLSFCV